MLVGVIIVYLVFLVWVMKLVFVLYGVVVNGLQLLFVVLYVVWLLYEWLLKVFWVSVVVGSVFVIVFVLCDGGGIVQVGDVLMFVVVGIGVFGYVEGVCFVCQIGGWQVICWVFVVLVLFFVLLVGWFVWMQYVVYLGLFVLCMWFVFGYVIFFL